MKRKDDTGAGWSGNHKIRWREPQEGEYIWSCNTCGHLGRVWVHPKGNVWTAIEQSHDRTHS